MEMLLEGKILEQQEKAKGVETSHDQFLGEGLLLRLLEPGSL